MQVAQTTTSLYLGNSELNQVALRHLSSATNAAQRIGNMVGYRKTNSHQNSHQAE
jgi:hypothetical protein